jgi:hypothetical protein
MNLTTGKNGKCLEDPCRFLFMQIIALQTITAIKIKPNRLEKPVGCA